MALPTWVTKNAKIENKKEIYLNNSTELSHP
jgi:hypothetical protein